MSEKENHERVSLEWTAEGMSEGDPAQKLKATKHFSCHVCGANYEKTAGEPWKYVGGDEDDE